MRYRQVVMLGLAALLLLALPAVARAGDYWVRNNAGHRVGFVRETGPTIDDWSFVFNASGRRVGDAPGHYAKMLSQVQFFGRNGGIWLASGRKLFPVSGGPRVIGYAKRIASGKWAVFRKTSSGDRRKGTVRGDLPACHALMGLRLLLWK